LKEDRKETNPRNAKDRYKLPDQIPEMLAPLPICEIKTNTLLQVVDKLARPLMAICMKDR